MFTFSAEAALMRMLPLGAENCSQQIHCSTQHSLPDEETLQGCKPENAQCVPLLQILGMRCLGHLSGQNKCGCQTPSE